MQSSRIKVYDLTPFTLLDFPDRPAAIIWLAGCNMRCPYCHNPDIVYGKNEMSFDKVEVFLQKRKRVLEGVVLSGGEPTLHKDIISICKRVKNYGYKIKLDTNGSRPDVLAKLIELELLDYVALDMKAPKEKFLRVTQSHFYDQLVMSIELLEKSSIQYELRTTVHTALLDEADIEMIVGLLEELKCDAPCYLQNFRSSAKLLGDVPDQQRVLERDKFQRKNIFFRNF